MPSMFCSGSVACRRSRLRRRIDCVRRYSSSRTQEHEGGAAAAFDDREEGALTLDQLHMMGRRGGELVPIELLLQCVKDIVIDRARVP